MNKKKKTMQSETQYINLYNDCRDIIFSHSCDVMNSQRDRAYSQFKAQGLPTRKVERYKYTSMQDVFQPDLGLNLNRLDIPVNPYDAFKCDVPNLSTQLYFVVNDQFYSRAMPKVELPKGVIVGSLRDEAIRNPELIARYYNRLTGREISRKAAPAFQEGCFDGAKATLSDPDKAAFATREGSSGKTIADPVTCLNTMLAQDGLLIYVPKGVRVDRTIQVINILRSDVDMMVNRRVLIIMEEDTELKLLFCDHAADDRQFLATQVVEVFVGENASLQMYSLEETHVKSTLVSNTYIDQRASSRVVSSNITLHNGTTRNLTELQFTGEGAECWLNGGIIADKQQRVDSNTLIDHMVPHCQSHELYKYVLDNEAVGAFAGRVLVREQAQHTTSEETNQNLCSTKTARMYTQPMLEIYADDVKCSHGSTVGQLNDKALFYMQQRGIPLREARLLLQTAFITEVVDQIPLEPLRDRLHYLIDKRFRGELSKCEGCKLCK